MNLAAAVRTVEEAGILLVFPNQNRPDPPSLWDKLYPARKMRWDWAETADSRVVDLWSLRERLAESGKVAYGKWYRGRATLFSLSVFRGMLASFSEIAEPTARLSHEARELLEILEDDSPQSTKVLRERADLRGREREGAYTRAMRELWTRLLIVGVGEVADGAFPSLSIGATRLIFEELWDLRKEPKLADARALAAALERSKGFAKQFAETRETLRRAVAE
jgi:hypothetical protein